MKALKKMVSVNVNDQYKTADTVNMAGGKAWKMSNKSRVEQLSMTGTLGNSYYASQKDAVDGAIEVLEQADALELKNAIVKGRNEGYVRAFNILALVYLSKKNSVLFKEAFSEVVLTGNDMKDFIDLTNQMRGFGRAIKSAMHVWLSNKVNEYYALKYRNEIADAIRISRFKGKDAIYKFVLSAYLGKVIKSRKKVKDGQDKGDIVLLSEKDVEKAFEKYPKLNAFRDAQKLIDDGEFLKAAKLIDKHSLDVESLMSKADKFDGAVWDAIAKQSPTMRFLKYLNKFIKVGVFDRQPDLFKEKLNVEALKKAKVFPFRLYIAYKNIEDSRVQNHLADVLNDYVSIYDWGEFNKYKWVVAPDVSGSMRSMMSRSDGKQGTMSYSTIAGMFSGFLYKGLTNCDVVPWGDRVCKYNTPRADSILTHIGAIERAPGGGTYMEVPVNHMIEKNIKADYAVFITDNMEWGSGWLNSWVQYKKINPKAKAFLLRLDGYAQQAFDDQKADELGVYQIFGWSDNVISYMDYQISN